MNRLSSELKRKQYMIVFHLYIILNVNLTEIYQIQMYIRRPIYTAIQLPYCKAFEARHLKWISFANNSLYVYTIQINTGTYMLMVKNKLTIHVLAAILRHIILSLKKKNILPQDCDRGENLMRLHFRGPSLLKGNQNWRYNTLHLQKIVFS